MRKKIVVNAEGEEKEVKGVISPDFVDKKIVPPTPELYLQSMIDIQRLRREHDPSQSEANVNIETRLSWIAVFHTGDWHIGSERTDYALWSKHMNLVRETDGLYMNVIGDERDNFIIPKYATGRDEHVITPHQQAEFVEYHLKELDERGKILARAGGNHDGWTWMMSGLHLEWFWYKGMNSPLLENGGFLHLTANKAKYDLYLHHGITIFNSNFNPSHRIKRSYEFQGRFDIGSMGHSHVAEVAHSWRNSDSQQHDYVQLSVGTYKLDDQFARSRSLGRGQPPGATILLSTKERRMIPFLRLEDAVEVLESLND